MVHDCDEVLWRYASDVAADEEEACRVEAHLGVCEACAQRVRAMRHLRGNFERVFVAWPGPAPDALAAQPAKKSLANLPQQSDAAPKGHPPTADDPSQPRARTGPASQWWRLWGDGLRVRWVLACGFAAAVLIVTALVFDRGDARGFVAFRDSTGPVLIREDGTVALPKAVGFPEEWMAKVALLVQRGEIRPSDSIRAATAALNAESSRLGAVTPSEIRLVSPIGGFVRGLTPTFQWSTPTNARDVRIVIAEAGRIVWEGRATAGPDYQLTLPSALLRPGTTYSWQVEAHVDDELRLSSQPRFSTLPVETDKELTLLESQAGTSALARLTLYASFGLSQAARGELDKLREINPGNPAIQQLAEALAHESSQ